MIGVSISLLYAVFLYGLVRCSPTSHYIPPFTQFEGQNVSYIVKSKIGEGGCGQVYLALSKGKKYAIKVCMSPSIERQQHLCDEMNNHKIIKRWSPASQLHFVTAIEYYCSVSPENQDNESHSPASNGYESNSEEEEESPIRGEISWIVFPYFPEGNLLDYITYHQPSVYQAIEISKDILKGLAALHYHDYIYFDLKPENVIVTDINSDTGRLSVKLIDLGSLVSVNELDKRMRWVTETFKAPELFMFEEYLGRPTTKTDMWSFGILLYELFNRRPFPSKENYRDQLIKAAYSEFQWKLHSTDDNNERITMNKLTGCIDPMRDYHQSCLLKDIKGCYCHLLLRCLKFRSRYRISSNEALNHPLFELINEP